MKRHQAYFGVLVLLLSFILLLKFWSTTFVSDNLTWFSQTAPWLFLMWLGCYCLGKLGLDLYLCNDFPSEIRVLEAVNYKYKDNDNNI